MQLERRTVYRVISREPGTSVEFIHWTVEPEGRVTGEDARWMAEQECSRQQERGWPGSRVEVLTGFEHDFAPDYNYPLCFNCPAYAWSEAAKLPCPGPKQTT